MKTSLYAIFLALFALDTSAQQKLWPPIDMPVSGRLMITIGGTPELPIVVENFRISTTNTPCIYVGPGVKHVIIRNNELGPCGNGTEDNEYGVLIADNASYVTVENNVIHDVSTGVKAVNSNHPLKVHDNTFYRLKGQLWGGQAVQFVNVSPASPPGIPQPSRITCNLSDATIGTGPKFYLDHLSFVNTRGYPGAMVEIAYNRLRGGSDVTGSGMVVGDGGGSYFWVHDNIVLTVANAGIGVAGGTDIVVENNVVDQRGPDVASKTHNALYVKNHHTSACTRVTLRGNRVISRLWIWEATDGRLHQGYKGVETRPPSGGYTYPTCTAVDDAANFIGDTSIAIKFDEVPPQCR